MSTLSPTEEAFANAARHLFVMEGNRNATVLALIAAQRTGFLADPEVTLRAERMRIFRELEAWADDFMPPGFTEREEIQTALFQACHLTVDDVLPQRMSDPGQGAR